SRLAGRLAGDDLDGIAALDRRNRVWIDAVLERVLGGEGIPLGFASGVDRSERVGACVRFLRRLNAPAPPFDSSRATLRENRPFCVRDEAAQSKWNSRFETEADPCLTAGHAFEARVDTKRARAEPGRHRARNRTAHIADQRGGESRGASAPGKTD